MIATQLVCLASHIWRARATSYDAFMGAAMYVCNQTPQPLSLPKLQTLRLTPGTRLSGVGAGPAETLQPIVIADIYFLHDRGKWNTLYWVIYMAALVVMTCLRRFRSPGTFADGNRDRLPP